MHLQFAMEDEHAAVSNLLFFLSLLFLSFSLQVSRLHTVTEICQSIYKELKHVLLQSDDKYALYYPEKKVIYYKPIFLKNQFCMHLFY